MDGLIFYKKHYLCIVKWKGSLILLLMLFLIADGMKSQTAWQHIDALPCEETSAVTQDSCGFIWIGTRLGLLRYDGYAIKTYRNDMTHPYAFSSCNILSLDADGGECVWAGSFFGLNRFSPATGQTIPIHFGVNDLVKAVCVDSRKRRWAGTDSGLYRVTSETETEHFEAVPRDMILQIRELADGQVVVMTQVDRDFLRRCTESVNTHIADPDYSHTVMMAEVGASHATLYRKLKALTGMDATSFIRSIRMRAAYQILTTTPAIRINELAERVGYSNARYFSTCFKNEYGVTPRECLANLPA